MTGDCNPLGTKGLKMEKVTEPKEFELWWEKADKCTLGMFKITATQDANAKLMLRIVDIEDAKANHYFTPKGKLLPADNKPKGY